MKIIVIFFPIDKGLIEYTLPSRRVRGSDFDRMRGEMSIITKVLYANEYSQKLVTGSADENLDASILLPFPCVIIDLAIIESRLIFRQREETEEITDFTILFRMLELASNNYLLKRFLRFARWKLCGSPIKPSNNFQFSVM